MLIERIVVHPALRKPYYIASDGSRYRSDPSKVEVIWRV
jgi:hypothetical protein